jgi:DNA-binding MarR family transcriptional regulator
MNRDWHELEVRKPAAAATLPPAMVEETGWDILLALHSGGPRELNLDKLASIVSVSQSVLHSWLSGLEQRELIAGTADRLTGEVRAHLTSAGRSLLDRYLSATNDLQIGTAH